MGNNKTETVVGWTVVAGLAAALGFGLAPIVTNANAEPAAVVETDQATDLTKIGYTNGLAGEQESEAAALEAARIAAEAEAARVAAEQAAAAEAARIAAERAEQQAAESYDAPSGEEPPAYDPWAGKTPVPFIVDPNPENAAGGFYDVSQCASGSASTGPDGIPYCD